MPRKLPEHSSLLLFFLKNILPKNWKILQDYSNERNGFIGFERVD